MDLHPRSGDRASPVPIADPAPARAPSNANIRRCGNHLEQPNHLVSRVLCNMPGIHRSLHDAGASMVKVVARASLVFRVAFVAVQRRVRTKLVRMHANVRTVIKLAGRQIV